MSVSPRLRSMVPAGTHHRSRLSAPAARLNAAHPGHQPMGATPLGRGVAFRVWAPNAKAVAVVGVFNDWDPTRHPMAFETNGRWAIEIAEAACGDEYRYAVTTVDGLFLRIDPYAREMSGPQGNAIVHDPSFDWRGDAFQPPPREELVIYELHAGTFSATAGDGAAGDGDGQFDSIGDRLSYLKRLGVNAVQIMPVSQFGGTRSWGYNPAHIFSVALSYGGPLGLKQFVRRAHEAGMAVILDVVYNHLGPDALDLWRFDGWSENGGGGIYFYNDDRAKTPWGDTRPDYRRGEVRQFIRDNVMMWLGEYHIDGLRFDCTEFIHTVSGSPEHQLPEGWSLLQWINREVSAAFPGRITIAEDLQSNSWLTKESGAGGAGFGSQWDAQFVHPIRAAVIAADDGQRSLAAVRDAITYRYNDDAFDRVIYSESHDEVANGQSRVPQEVNPGYPTGWYAQKRSTLAAAMVFTAPGIPMLFQGQEFLEGGWFRDTVPVDWEQRTTFRGILRLYQDLIALRLSRDGRTKGLLGQSTRVTHLNETRKLLAFHRWSWGGPSDDVIVVANFSNAPYERYALGFPRGGRWRLRFNSDWECYSEKFAGHRSADVEAVAGAYDGFGFRGDVSMGPYSVLIYSQDALPAKP